MSDGARTRDILDHNQVLYQLSYAHHDCCAGCPGCWEVGAPSGDSNPEPAD